MSTLKVKVDNEWKEVGSIGSVFAGLAGAVDVLNGKVDAIHASNPNLLDNPFFSVNQRGATTWTLSNTYFVDRFKYIFNGTGAKVEVASDGTLTYTCTDLSYLIQPIEPSLASSLDGKVVTASILVDGVVRSITFTYDASKRDYRVDIEGTPWHYWYGGNGEVCFRCNTSGIYTIKAVKLELGSHSTLAYDSAPNYADELARCQRYYYRFYGVLTGVWLTSSLLRFSVPTPVRMRSTTRVVTYNYAQFHYGGSWHDYGSTTGMTLSAIQFEDCVLINVTGVSSTAYNACWAELNIGISADL